MIFFASTGITDNDVDRLKKSLLRSVLFSFFTLPMRHTTLLGDLVISNSFFVLRSTKRRELAQLHVGLLPRPGIWIMLARHWLARLLDRAVSVSCPPRSSISLDGPSEFESLLLSAAELFSCGQ
jgi:hypothetical protein